MVKSINGGGNWKAAASGITNTGVDLVIGPAATGTLYAGTWGGGVRKSTNAGAGTGSAANTGLTGYLLFYALGDFDPASHRHALCRVTIRRACSRVRTAATALERGQRRPHCRRHARAAPGDSTRAATAHALRRGIYRAAECTESTNGGGSLELRPTPA